MISRGAKCLVHPFSRIILVADELHVQLIIKINNWWVKITKWLSISQICHFPTPNISNIHMVRRLR